MVIVELAERMLEKGHSVTVTQDPEGKIALHASPGSVIAPKPKAAPKAKTTAPKANPPATLTVASGGTATKTTARKKTTRRKRRKKRKVNAGSVTEAHVKEMKSLRKHGSSDKEIAQKTGWSLQTVKRYI